VFFFSFSFLFFFYCLAVGREITGSFWHKVSWASGVGVLLPELEVVQSGLFPNLLYL
jgi:hypothetical protein